MYTGEMSDLSGVTGSFFYTAVFFISVSPARSYDIRMLRGKSSTESRESPKSDGALTALPSDWWRRRYLPIPVRKLQIWCSRKVLWILHRCRPSAFGLALWCICFRFIWIFQPIPIWQSVWDWWSDSIIKKISIIHIFQILLQNSGGAGIFPWAVSSGTMYTYRSAATGKAAVGRSLTFLSSGRWRGCGMVPVGTLFSGDCIILFSLFLKRKSF